jgi:beta-glucanase (GH16 family)
MHFNHVPLFQLTLFTSLLALAGLGIWTLPASADPPAGYRLEWSEEFSGPVGSPPDKTHWSYDLGDNGWGNNELENYVSDVEHAHIVLDPAATNGKALQILATYNGHGLTRGNFESARLVSRDKVTAQYGYIEARICLPSGQGLWPAFWMLGADIGTPGVGWPQCGEMDIMENIGREPAVNHSSLHGPGYSGGKSLTGKYALPDGQQFAGGYHTFGLLWAADSVTFSVDGHPFETRTPADLPAGKTWAFNHPFFFIVNVAVGGNFGGNPDATTAFPQKMLVDYIRVYKPS